MALAAGQVRTRQTGSSGTANQVTNIYCLVQAIDLDKNVAHVRDQIGGQREISLNHQIGKGYTSPQEGETWMLTSLFGDWMFAVQVDPQFPSFLSVADFQVYEAAIASTLNGLQSEINNISFLGEIRMYGGTVAPSQWKFCDGASLSTTGWPDLFGVIGYTYGGSGANFNLPDFTNRFPRGLILGPGGGADTHTHAFDDLGHQHSGAAHTHSFDDGGHNHNLSSNGHAQITAVNGTIAVGRDNTTSWTESFEFTATGGTVTAGSVARTTAAILMGRTDNANAVGTTGSTTPGNGGITHAAGTTGSGSNVPAYTGVKFIIRAQ